ncbi:hypothetical protein [Bacillus cereus]
MSYEQFINLTDSAKVVLNESVGEVIDIDILSGDVLADWGGETEWVSYKVLEEANS